MECPRCKEVDDFRLKMQGIYTKGFPGIPDEGQYVIIKKKKTWFQKKLGCILGLILACIIFALNLHFNNKYFDSILIGLGIGWVWSTTEEWFNLLKG